MGILINPVDWVVVYRIFSKRYISIAGSHDHKNSFNMPPRRKQAKPKKLSAQFEAIYKKAREQPISASELRKTVSSDNNSFYMNAKISAGKDMLRCLLDFKEELHNQHVCKICVKKNEGYENEYVSVLREIKAACVRIYTEADITIGLIEQMEVFNGEEEVASVLAGHSLEEASAIIDELNKPTSPDYSPTPPSSPGYITQEE